MIREDDIVQLTVQYTIGHQLALVLGPDYDAAATRRMKAGTVLRVLAVRSDGMALVSSRLSPPRFWGTTFPVKVEHLIPYSDPETERIKAMVAPYLSTT